jgi:hypothetical protein
VNPSPLVLKSLGKVSSDRQKQINTARQHFWQNSKLGGEALIPYLVQLLDIKINSATIPSDWKKPIVVPTYKGDDRSLVANYRPISLTSVVCKQMEHFMASYLRKVWDKKDWLFKGQHGLRLGYPCESQVKPGHCRLTG